MSNKKDIESLLNKGKHYVCQYITTGCYEPAPPDKPWKEVNLGEKVLSQHDHRRVHYVIDHLFDLRQIYDPRNNDELVEWIKYLICGRRLPNTFAKEVKQYDVTSKCCQVWTTNFVAYRCRTCALSLCMSLCLQCFRNGNHENHDFNMFRSQAGGACDCGDAFVMKPEGFCRDHQPRTEPFAQPPPNSLLCISREVVPRLLFYLVLYLRENNLPYNRRANALINDVLIYLNDLGTLMQSIICKALIDSDYYKSSLIATKETDLVYQHRLQSLADNYRKAVQEIELATIFPKLKNIVISELDNVKGIDSFALNLKHESFLDEIIFWTIINEFPSNLIIFLLKMLPNEEYKVHFANCFVKHYFRISMLILHPNDRFFKVNDNNIYQNKLANAVVHISVQLFSNENLALLLCEKSKLLYIIILTLKFGICGNQKDYWGILTANTDLGFSLRAKRSANHYVVQCDHPILRQHRFWPMISDLNNLFTHRRVALVFLNDDILMDLWFEFITAFQAMNVNLRSTKADDTNTNYKSSYLAELEICSSQMWTMISHLRGEPESKQLTINLTNKVREWIEKWLHLISYQPNKVDHGRCTFHLPLHRYYSVLIHHALTTLNVDMGYLAPIDNADKLKSIVTHPLDTLIACAHVMANLWHNYGPNIKTQAMNYTQPHFCNSTIDADMFLVQQAASYLSPDDFVEFFFQRYGLLDQLNLNSIANGEMETNKLGAFLENGFSLLASIACVHLNIGMESSDVTRKELVSLLSVSHRTHSQIQDMLPYKWGFMQNSFSDILNNIAEFKSPEVETSGSLVQGYFFPKNEVWEKEYDPMFILYRYTQRRDFQSSLERFAQYARQSGKYDSASLPWPPFRIPPPVMDKFVDPRVILKSKMLHASLFSILHKALKDQPPITQHLLSIITFLLELSFIEYSNVDNLPKLDLNQLPCIETITEFDMTNWYPTNDFLTNFITTIKTTTLLVSAESEEAVRSKLLASMLNTFMPDDNNNDDSNPEDDTPWLIESQQVEEVPVAPSSPVEVDEDESMEEGETMDSLTLAAPQVEAPGEVDMIEDDIRLSIEPTELLQTAFNITFGDNTSEETSPLSSLSQTQMVSWFTKCLPNPLRGRLRFDVNESMLSLLLKLHSKLSEKRDSFKSDPAHLEKYDLELRIGDGPFFIGCLLKRFMHTCAKRLVTPEMDFDQCWSRVVNLVDDVRQTIWPKPVTVSTEIPSDQPSSSCDASLETDIDLEQEERRLERKRKAMERKQQIMQQFSMMQNDFIKNNKFCLEEASMESASGEQSSNDSHESSDSKSDVSYQAKSYQCVICTDSGCSTLERSFVQVVLLQSSSVLGNSAAHTLCDELTDERLPYSSTQSTVPITDDEYCQFSQRKTLAHYFEVQVDRCISYFDKESWLGSFNIGWCGGVHAQSCGHFMHLDCYQSYISSIHHNREPNELIDYTCPLCRKNANSVLPIIPNFANLYALVKSRKDDPREVALEIMELLSNCNLSQLANTTEDESKFLKVLAMAIEDVMKATEPQYRNIRVDPTPQSLFVFLSSISRTNLEFNTLYWRRGMAFAQNNCLVPLFQALSLNAKLVLPMHFSRLWSQLTGLNSEEDGSQLLLYEKPVPILLRDVSCILVQFLYSLPFYTDKAYFISIVQALLNLNFLQAVVMMTYLLTFNEKMEIKKKAEGKSIQLEFVSFFDYISYIVNSFDITILSSSIIEINRKEINEELMVESVARVCLPFLRLSSMVYHLFFDQPLLPDIAEQPVLHEFSLLANYLSLNNFRTDTALVCTATNPPNEHFFHPYIHWMSNPFDLISTWYSQLDKFIQCNTMAALNLIQESRIITHLPRLLDLPSIYEQLFIYYHKKICDNCHNVPKEPSICLVCGKMICLREACCRNGNIFEGTMHAKKCGAGLALYLPINSTTIILIKGRKACAWGSVYLDEYGEEDRDLKRGKPLYLCRERYQILEQQWLMHNFSNLNKKWIYHKDAL